MARYLEQRPGRVPDMDLLDACSLSSSQRQNSGLGYSTCGGLRVWLGPCRSLLLLNLHRPRAAGGQGSLPICSATIARYRQSFRASFDHVCSRLMHLASSPETDKMQSTIVTATASPCTHTQVKAELSASEPDSSPFFWSYTEEPHRTRRQAIIKAHPEVGYRGLVRSLILMRIR